MPASKLKDIVATLLTNGFNITKIDRLPHENNIIHIYKYDKLGATVNYSILFSNDSDENSIIDILIAEAENHTAKALIVSDHFTSTRCQTYTHKAFFNFFGGIINTGLILIPNLSQILNDLGHNILPPGTTGKPDDLHEFYVKECFQFILESPTRRYGIDRSFESVPDIVVLSNNGFMLLIDSKAYSNGFPFDADSIKRFKSYVEDFRLRYSSIFGMVLSFVVVSGSFPDSENSLSNRSDELYQTCGCKLSCITSKQLGLITELLKTNPETRGSINWRNIFTKLIIDSTLINKEILRINKDKIH
jgi:hypothetical protein